MKKEFDLLDITKKPGKIGGEKEQIFLTIIDCGIVIETDNIIAITENYIHPSENNTTLREVKQFLHDRGLKSINVVLKYGFKVNNIIIKSDKPLISIFS